MAECLSSVEYIQIANALTDQGFTVVAIDRERGLITLQIQQGE